MKQPSLIIGDDHTLVIEGLKRILSQEFDVLGIAGDGEELVALALETRPALVIADISMPRMNGIEALKKIREQVPETRVVMLSMHRDDAYVASSLVAGASGYVLKHSDPKELIGALHSALDGDIHISPAVAGDALAAVRSGKPLATDITDRQRRVIELISAGLTVKEIAVKEDISSKTVEYHKYRLQKLLGVKTTAELIRAAVERGLVT